MNTGRAYQKRSYMIDAFDCGIGPHGIWSTVTVHMKKCHCSAKHDEEPWKKGHKK
jgi:hypothetical protein